MTLQKIGIGNIFILIMIGTLSIQPWYVLMLTIAQIIFVPLTLHLVMKHESGWIPNIYPYLGIIASLAILLLNVTDQTKWDPFLAAIYFLFTVMVAFYGMIRFLQRGFVDFEEFVIDVGLMYLAIGGAWFLAYESHFDTGFSPMLTWLTSIHFHYSAFLLPIFVGFLGRLTKPHFYIWIGWIVILAPFIVALGITYSHFLELLSVVLYFVGIYSLIVLSFKAPLRHCSQKWLIRLSFTAIGGTIVFSLMYAMGQVTIDFMLRSHGILNALLFAFIGLLGWSIDTPPSRKTNLTFPVSNIKGDGRVGEAILTGKVADQTYTGLVDDMGSFEPDISMDLLATTIIDFYENTINYKLFCTVKWRFWFKPIAAIYKLVSQKVQQVNLPMSSQQVEMTGAIFAIKDELDGRSKVRAWVRKIKEDITFVALYSSHKTQARTYMNIALPLPWSTMIGILELQQSGSNLRLTSKRAYDHEAHSGIYLAVMKTIFKLPLEEHFCVKEVEDGVLEAKHTMWIFSIPFLTINYDIDHKDKLKQKTS